ncbi:hypothetical protein AN401_11625 [Zobellella denitrificans]|uniref:Uncharacterized protein n=2 Tax=Zobellella denitrificans TaxID=347534 RepID=A0A291HQB0_9GAMM|nr:hypothetical protein AN401_11110 [Zobellella denitrificans]ATG74422.1 hypothetical protein AN401_11625 [Zobellella denitrificans]
MEKLKKLMALAQSGNPHEAANALAKAQKLMAEHKIDADALELADLGESLVRMATNSDKPPRWSLMLVSLIREAFGVEAVITRELFSATRQVRFYGLAERAEIAGYCHDVLRRQLARARKDYIAGLSKRMKPANKTARADQFCEGWCYGVRQAVDKLVPSEREQVLMRRYQEQVIKPNGTTTGRSAGSVRGGDNARGEGFVAGRQVQLNPGMTGRETGKLGVTDA